jgi:hypothetical protein
MECYVVDHIYSSEIAIREIMTDPELRPPFEVEAITHQNAVIRFTPARLDSAPPAADHFVPLLSVGLVVESDLSLRLTDGGQARRALPAIPAEWEGCRRRIRYVAVTLGTETRYYEAGPGLIVPEPIL